MLGSGMLDGFESETEHVREMVRLAGPLAAYARLIRENNALISAPELDNNREITAAALSSTPN